MKKISLVLTVALVLAGISRVSAVVGPTDDTDKATHVVGITLPTIKLVDLEDGTGAEASALTWDLEASDFTTEAGALSTGIENDNVYYLQYTSLQASSGTSLIRASMTGDNWPNALRIAVKAGSSVGGGAAKGNVGTGTDSYETLSLPNDNKGKKIVGGIKTCYTGTGDTKGHKVKYKLIIDDSKKEDFGALVAGTYTATITYTIVAN